MSTNGITGWITELLKDPRFHIPLTVLKGFRNGLVYGVKIRLPHALVMTFLFHNGSFQEKIRAILLLTYQHARNLALTATFYKLSTLISEKILGRKSRLVTFFSAFVPGYFIFGTNNKLNMQMNLYLLPRVILALVNLAVKKNLIPSMNAFPWFAALVFGFSLLMFEHEHDTVQRSFSSSMTYIYHDCEHWTNLWDLFVYNTL